MTRKPRPSDVEGVPAAPPPSAQSPVQGIEDARSRARRFLPDCIDLPASIALSKDSEAALHTKMLACKELVTIATGALPQPTPAAPAPPRYEGDGRREPD
jgi:hypothetical protein